MFCGTSALHQMDADNPPAPSKTSKKRHHSKNPYSSRGLDKFSSVLTDLESRKKKIMESTSSQGVSMVRFMYSDSRDWIPVIVRLRDDNTSKINTSNLNKKPMLVNELPPLPPPLLTTVEEITEPLPEKKKKKEEVVVEEERRWWRRRPSYYMPVAMMLILLCFVISGRAFAICCISAFWFSIPALKADVKGRNFIKSVHMKIL